MNQNDVLMKLRDLHDELVGLNDDLRPSQRVDDETINALGQLVTDLGELVESIKDNRNDMAPGDLQKQLVDRIESFETRHPRVTQFLSQVTDFLAMIGI